MKVKPTNVYKHLTVPYITLYYNIQTANILHVHVLANPAAILMVVLYKAYITNSIGEPMGSILHSWEKNVGKIRTIEGESITRQYGKKEQAEGTMYSPDCTM
jgi:hypothetical protein